MKRYSLITTLCILMITALITTAHAEIVFTEEAVEAESFDVTLKRDGTGYIVAKNCPSCPTLKMAVNDQTRITTEGKAMPLDSLHGRTKKGATIIYDPRTMVITRIFW